MSSFYYGSHQNSSNNNNNNNSGHHQNNHSNNNHHGGRSRRAPRLAGGHNHRQFRAVRSPKEIVEAANVTAFRRDFEAARSFDFEDDEMFCPFHLLTEDDLHSMSSSASDRSSLSSGSPESSPLQHQIQPTPTFLLPSASNFTPSNFHHGAAQQTKIHQPLAQRTRNAIPIVDPSTRTIASPPPSVSPARQMAQQFNMGRRW